MTPLKRYLIILLFMIIGIGFGIGFGAVFYIIRKKKDDQITMGGSIKNIIIPSIFFWVTIGILIIVKMQYCIPLCYSKGVHWLEEVHLLEVIFVKY